ncbi:MAG TPA: YceI family protein [Thermoanaerobaculia bacterium]|nr:YceI family protein [Thermoanaerobaculia bacterium]
MNRNSIAALALSALAALPVHAAEVYTIDAGHSDVSFQVRHLVTQVRGKFSDYQGTIQLDPAKLENSKVELRIKAASIDTALPDRDKHLRSEDFFFVEKYPEITFKSQQIKATGKDTYDVTGALTLRGVTKTVTLPVTFLGKVRDPWGNDKAGFATEATINRKDYGIVWNAALDNGGVVLGDDVKIAINLETQLQKDAAKKGK